MHGAFKCEDPVTYMDQRSTNTLSRKSERSELLDHATAFRLFQLKQAHSNLELLLAALKVDGDGESENSRIFKAARSGGSDEEVLAIATEVLKTNTEL